MGEERGQPKADTQSNLTWPMTSFLALSFSPPIVSDRLQYLVASVMHQQESPSYELNSDISDSGVRLMKSTIRESINHYRLVGQSVS